MSAAVWVLQGILAAIFLVSGVAKSVMSKQRMIESGQTGVAPFPLSVIRMVAICEIAGAVGLVAPMVTGVARPLTLWAAGGLCVVMIGAAVSHWSLREYKQVFAVNLVLFLMLMTVIWYRSVELW